MMTVLSMMLFSFSMSASPGPVNLLTLSNGINYGFKATLPFVWGAVLGFTIMLSVVGLGLGLSSGVNPIWGVLLGLTGCVFIFSLGFKLVGASASVTQHTPQQKLGFKQGSVIQWLNPKAWIACLAGTSAFQLIGDVNKLLLFVGIYFVVCFLCVASWAFLGEKISRLLSSTKQLTWFNRIMGGLLMAIAVGLAASYF